ncbi:LysR family transcriptional regulator [Acidovorax sp. Leaf160]|uniref:LysR family transcriptional regulator n=1 Tax=Acidovorax sp. Leaf160 TaxID=1736280 RepID=UPI0009EC8FAE|nr:LysR family transcriptional regulator [Acidovorax sp. Leaf160]
MQSPYNLNSVMSRLHARQLRLLIAVAEHGSLLAAADHVGLTQPGASKALKELEATLNAPLFTRTNRGLVPTEAGTCAVRFARLIQSDISHLQQELSAIASGAGGRIAVGTIMGAVPLLTRAVSQLLDQQPDLSVEIVEDTSASLLALIDQGRLDAAICRSSVSPKPHLYDSIVIKDESLAVVAHRAHPAAGLPSITLQDLSASRWVMYRAHMPMRRTLEREFFEENLFFPTHLIETTSALATLSLLSHNANLVALVSDDVADYVCQHGMVARLPLQLKSRSEPYELIARRNAHRHPALALLIDALLALRPPAEEAFVPA